LSIDLAKLASQRGQWLRGTGPESDVVLSTRVRLARNLSDYAFLTRISPEDRLELVGRLTDCIGRLDGGGEFALFRLDELDETCKQMLMERHIISRELADAEGPSAVAFDGGENVSIMIAEEDHLRMQVIGSGLDLYGTWKRVDEMDDKIEEQADYAFSHKYGYLTACPTNVGTGMRSSVMMHLPALVMTKHIEKVYTTVAQMNLAVRGLYGEGTQAYGDFFQVSNQITLGKSEKEIVEEVRAVAITIIEYERKARRWLLEQDSLRLRDKISRDLAVLKNAHLVDSQEAMGMLSSARLGIFLGLIKGAQSDTVNELFLAAQSAHLQAGHDKKLSTDERRAARAELFHEALKDARMD